jgi:hypothetical protein
MESQSMSRITGLNKLSRNLDEAIKAMEALDGELAAVTFDPNDPSGIEAAILKVETIVDERVGPYVSNPIVKQIVRGMKEQYREALLERAAAARLGSEKS